MSVIRKKKRKSAPEARQRSRSAYVTRCIKRENFAAVGSNDDTPVTVYPLRPDVTINATLSSEFFSSKLAPQKSEPGSIRCGENGSLGTTRKLIKDKQ